MPQVTLIIDNSVYTGNITLAGKTERPAPQAAVTQQPELSQLRSYHRKTSRRVDGMAGKSRWTKEEDEKIVRLMKEGIQPAQIGILLHRTGAAVSHRAARLRREGADLPKFGNGPGKSGKGKVS